LGVQLVKDAYAVAVADKGATDMAPNKTETAQNRNPIVLGFDVMLFRYRGLVHSIITLFSSHLSTATYLSGCCAQSRMGNRYLLL